MARAAYWDCTRLRDYTWHLSLRYNDLAGSVFGIPAKTAAEYSFLLSIPAILGAVALKIRDVEDTTIPLYIVGAGMLAAFIVGYIALRLLLVVLNRGKFSLFSYYCIALGLVSLLIALIQ